MLTALWLVALLTDAQSAIGTWRLYPAYHKATQCVVVGGKVYVLSDGALYSYTTSDEYVETYDKAGILSDQGIRHIALDEPTGTLVVMPWLPEPELMTTGREQPFIRASEAAAAQALARTWTALP